LAVEAILGIRLVAGALTIQPCLPRGWGRAEASINGPNGTINVVIEDPDRIGHGDVRISVDGKRRKKPGGVAFPGAGLIREVRVLLVRPTSAPSGKVKSAGQN
jgi:cyclic beta-1,2-glucan synthetase